MVRHGFGSMLLPILFWAATAAAQRPDAEPSREPTEDERLGAMLRRSSDCAAAGRRNEAIAVLSRVVDEHLQSAAGPEALWLLANEQLAIGEHAHAADHYARFAEQFPADDRAPEAAQLAIELDLALGRLQRALDGAERFERNYARSLSEQTAQVSASIGDALERRGDHGALVTHDRRWLRIWGDRAPVELRLHVEAQLARVLEASGRERDALEAHRRVVALWDGPEGNALRGAPDGAHVAADVAASLLALGDAERAAAEAQPFPTLRGRHIGVQKIGEWARDHLLPWIEARMEGLTRAARAYERVAELGPTVHGVAAATSVGEMWLELAASFDRAPTPAELQADPQLLQIYREAIEQQTRPLRERGIAALEYAVTLATAHHLFGPETRRALERLRAADPEQAGGEELLGGPVAPAGGVVPRGVLHGPPDAGGCAAEGSHAEADASG